ncbi:hypothetical protein [Stenotrophomonas sp. PS02289]|uniref:tetratricopeptide repeat protein n=1 Tax=Stenotrophomonas sp. PS02289 TaxID=2991422 RepID=UPI00249B7146|nr:hypothetical protein [Stenotrophomonas sp. PS02289]
MATRKSQRDVMPSALTEAFNALRERHSTSREELQLLEPYLAAGNAEAIYLSHCLIIDDDQRYNEAASDAALKEAASMGYIPAVYALGMRYRFGDSVEMDVTLAAEMLRVASDAGYPEAMYEYGLALFHGIGAPQDVGAALALIRRSAREGDEYAVEFLQAYSFDLDG